MGPMHIPFSKTCSKFERWEEEVPKFAPNFQNRLRNTMSYQALNRKFSQMRNKPTISSLFDKLLQITLLFGKVFVDVKSNQLHVVIFWFFFVNVMYIP